MVKRLLLICAFALAVSQPSGALERAHFELRSVGDLVALCDPPQADPDRWYGVVFCRGYIRGLGDFNRSFFRPGSLGICPPTPRPSVASVSDSYVAWAKANPAELQKTDIVDSILRWATHTYPCRPSR